MSRPSQPLRPRAARQYKPAAVRTAVPGFSFSLGACKTALMATGKKDSDREAELEAAIKKIREETFKPRQTLPALRRAIALILQELKR